MSTDQITNDSTKVLTARNGCTGTGRGNFDSCRLFHRLRALKPRAIVVQRKTGKPVQFKLIQGRLSEPADTTRAARWMKMFPRAALNPLTPRISYVFAKIYWHPMSGLASYIGRT